MNRNQREIELKAVLLGNFGHLIHLYEKATHKLAFGVLGGEMIQTILNIEFPWPLVDWRNPWLPTSSAPAPNPPKN